MIEEKEALKFYAKWHPVDPAKITEAELDTYFKDWTKERRDMKDPVAARRSFQLLHRVARQTNEVQWKQFANTGEMPPIKLSAEEMEVARGGIVIATVALGVALFMGAYTIVHNWNR